MEAPKYSRKTFDETDDQLKAEQESVLGDKSMHEVFGSLARRDSLEAQKADLHDQAWDMAKEEDGERAFAERQKTGKMEGRKVSPEQLRTNLEALESNIGKMSQLPETVLRSKEGQEATQSLMEKMTSKLAGFRQGLVEKLATLDSWKGKDRMAKVLGGVAGAAILAPVILQLARSSWPEVGVALDAAPDALQQLIHMDIWAKVADMLGNGDMLQNGSIWKNGGIEVNNLLSDISSGREALSSLSPEKLQVLKDGLDPESFDVLTSPHLKDPVKYATALANPTTILRTVFGNAPIIGMTAASVGLAMGKVGAFANKFKTKKA